MVHLPARSRQMNATPPSWRCFSNGGSIRAREFPRPSPTRWLSRQADVIVTNGSRRHLNGLSGQALRRLACPMAIAIQEVKN